MSRGAAPPVDARFDALGTFLAPGDLIVVNTSATVPAALDGRLPDGEPIVVHLSGELPGGVALVEVRRPSDGTTVPLRLDLDGTTAAVAIDLFGGGRVQLLTPFADSTRLWVAKLDDHAVGRPSTSRGTAVRSGTATCRTPWPIDAYQTVFADEPGSAEMPSASRPFTPELVTALVTRGIHFAPLLLHTGVSSLEGGERPYPERYRVPRDTAAMINAVRADGGHVVAAGTTVVRALATVTDDHGVVHPGRGLDRRRGDPGRRRCPRSTACSPAGTSPSRPTSGCCEAFADHDVLADAYATALDLGYRWHEFGDSHLILRERAVR